VRIEVFFTPPEGYPTSLQDATVAVVDVVRATTSMVEALAHGARAVFPVVATEDAVRLAVSLGREDTLLCGERRGEKVEGFDLGNSPREYGPDVVADKRLVWSTTNGTRAFAAAGEAGRVVAAAFTNLSACAREVADTEHVVVQCAGRLGRFALEDALCAGYLVNRLVESRDAVGETRPELDDAARAARALAQAVEPTQAFLASTEGGAKLVEIGLGEDLAVCARVDHHDVVPELMDQALTLPARG